MSVRKVRGWASARARNAARPLRQAMSSIAAYSFRTAGGMRGGGADEGRDLGGESAARAHRLQLLDRPAGALLLIVARARDIDDVVIPGGEGEPQHIADA